MVVHGRQAQHGRSGTARPQMEPLLMRALHRNEKIWVRAVGAHVVTYEMVRQAAQVGGVRKGPIVTGHRFHPSNAEHLWFIEVGTEAIDAQFTQSSGGGEVMDQREQAEGGIIILALIAWE